MRRKAVCFVLLFILAVCTLTGCSKKRRLKEARAVAENYLSDIKALLTDDTPELTADEPALFGELYCFNCISAKYNDTFTINVNADNSVTDTYFSAAITDYVAEETNTILDSALPNTDIKATVSGSKNIVASSLSIKNSVNFRSLHDVCAAAPYGDAVTFNLIYSGSAELTENDVSGFLKWMFENGYYSTVVVENDNRSFSITSDGVFYTDNEPVEGYVKTHEYIFR